MEHWIRRLHHFSVRAVEALITLYQYTFSPDHGMVRFFPVRVGCKFVPSCSQYAREAVRQYGLFRGTMVSLGRIIRCHPYAVGGYDPVRPQKT